MSSLHSGVQPSPFGGGGTSTTQELVPAEEPMPDAKDEHVPPKPFIFETDPVAQEEAAAQEPTSPTPIPEDSQPSAPASEPEQAIVKDPPTAPVSDLNEHVEDQQQDDQEF